MSDLLRPEIKNRTAFALKKLAEERSNAVHVVTYTELVNILIQEEWQRVHSDMQFPDQLGNTVSIECTSLPLNP
jgi:hypothetical protein